MDADQRRVLLVTQYFAPKNEIAAVRLSNLAAGLQRLGWQVDVLTVDANPANPWERRNDLDFPPELLEGVNVRSVAVPKLAAGAYTLFDFLQRRVTPRAPMSDAGAAGRPAARGAARALRRLAGTVRSGGLKLIDHAYIGAFADASLPRRDYDVVWGSFGPRYMIDAACAVAAGCPDAAFVMDIRDPIVRFGALRSDAQRAQVRAERRLAQQVDGLTLVSETFLHQTSLFTVPIATITNGFLDPGSTRDRSAVPRSPDAPLRVYYGGRLYPAQSLDALAVACRELSRRRPVEVHYAGPSAVEFRAAFHSHGASDLVTDHGFVSRADSLALADAADVCVVLSWNGAERGLMTGKVYELIAADVPLAVFIAGDARTATLAEVFAGDPVRRVFGAEASEQNVARVQEFLQGCADPDPVVRAQYRGVERYQQYDYRNLSARLAEFFETVRATR